MSTRKKSFLTVTSSMKRCDKGLVCRLQGFIHNPDLCDSYQKSIIKKRALEKRDQTRPTNLKTLISVSAGRSITGVSKNLNFTTVPKKWRNR